MNFLLLLLPSKFDARRLHLAQLALWVIWWCGQLHVDQNNPPQPLGPFSLPSLNTNCTDGRLLTSTLPAINIAPWLYKWWLSKNWSRVRLAVCSLGVRTFLNGKDLVNLCNSSPHDERIGEDDSFEPSLHEVRSWPISMGWIICGIDSSSSTDIVTSEVIRSDKRSTLSVRTWRDNEAFLFLSCLKVNPCWVFGDDWEWFWMRVMHSGCSWKAPLSTKCLTASSNSKP